MTGADVPPMFTVRQGEYLSFIQSYTTKVGVSPSFEDIARHFGTASSRGPRCDTPSRSLPAPAVARRGAAPGSPPNVDGMIKTLERRGLLSRSPGVARSLRVLVPAEALPGSNFGSGAARSRTPVVAAAVGSRSAADAAVAAA